MLSMLLRNRVMSALDAPEAMDRFEDRIFDLAAMKRVEMAAEDVAGLEDLAERYIRDTLRLLEACVTAANQAQAIGLFNPVVTACEQVFLRHDERIPDENGVFGMVCDCYVARELIASVSKQTLAIRGFPLLATDPHGEVEIIRRLIGAELCEILDDIVDEMFNQPAIRFSANGAYGLSGPLRATGRVSDWGASWEEQMADYGGSLGLALTRAA